MGSDAGETREHREKEKEREREIENTPEVSGGPTRFSRRGILSAWVTGPREREGRKRERERERDVRAG